MGCPGGRRRRTRSPAARTPPAAPRARRRVRRRALPSMIDIQTASGDVCRVAMTSDWDSWRAGLDGGDCSAVSSAVADGGELLGKAAAEGRHACEDAQRHIPQRANGLRGGGQSGEPVSSATTCMASARLAAAYSSSLSSRPSRSATDSASPSVTASRRPRFMPCPPAGLCVCAASPASSTRPARYWSATRSWIRNRDPQITSVTLTVVRRGPRVSSSRCA